MRLGPARCVPGGPRRGFSLPPPSGGAGGWPHRVGLGPSPSFFLLNTVPANKWGRGLGEPGHRHASAETSRMFLQDGDSGSFEERHRSEAGATMLPCRAVGMTAVGEVPAFPLQRGSPRAAPVHGYFGAQTGDHLSPLGRLRATLSHVVILFHVC